MMYRTVRIIGGRWRRSRLTVADRPGLRPTPDRVRETLFNWLGQDLTGWRCLDAFAGTGALGFEAASRGAANVLIVEQDVLSMACIERTRTKLAAHTVQVVRGDGVAVLSQQTAGSVDAVFLDPPYDDHTRVLEPALQAAARAVTPAGYVYLEARHRRDDKALQTVGLHVHRYLKAGAVHAHLLAPS